MALDELTADLDPEQRAAVLSDAAPLCIVAPAGSGKTRVLTRRIARRVADGSADERHVLAITFTRRASAELAHRLRQLGLREQLWSGTFHATALRLLKQRYADLQRPVPTLVASRASLVEELLRASGRAERRQVLEVAGEIDWARARRIDPERYPLSARRAERRTSLPGERVAGVYGAYEEAKRARRLMDFDDLLQVVLRELERDRAYAEATRWRFRHLFVDEFQDVNPLQHAFLEAIRGGRDDLCVVGDPRQAIYGWNGADASWLTGFVEHHRQATVLTLRRSHRSTPQILGLANSVLNGDEGQPAATRPDGMPPRFHAHADVQAEAAAVARLVRDARRPNGSWNAIAVLARTNAQLLPIAAALDRLNVPHRLRGGLLADARVKHLLREVGAETGRGSLRAWLDDRRAETAPDNPLGGLDSLAEDALALDPHMDGSTFRSWLAAGGHGDALAVGDAVTVTTFHAAKGLEWPVVVIAGAAKGVVPHAATTGRPGREEERRLLHVALTRAQDELHVTWPGGDENRSPFLPDVPAEPVAPPPAELLPIATPPPDPVIARLERWRAKAARAARVPPAFVCSDAALAAIATSRPTTLDELAALPELGPLAAGRLGARLLAALDETPASGDPSAERRVSAEATAGRP